MYKTSGTITEDTVIAIQKSSESKLKNDDEVMKRLMRIFIMLIIVIIAFITLVLIFQRDGYENNSVNPRVVFLTGTTTGPF